MIFLLFRLEGGTIGSLIYYYIIYLTLDTILKTSKKDDQNLYSMESLDMNYSFRIQRIAIRSSELRRNANQRKGPRNYNLSQRTLKRPKRKPIRENKTWFTNVLGYIGIQRKVPTTQSKMVPPLKSKTRIPTKHQI